MLNFKSYYSSSKGNLYTCSDGKTTIIIDFGVSFKKAQVALNFTMNKIDGAMSSHRHLDHCAGIPKALSMGMDCYLLPDTINKLKVSGHRVHEMEPMKLFKIGTLKILPFPLEHDVPNVGFIIESETGGKLVYIVDTAYCKFRFKDVDIFAIEANYSKKILDESIKSGVTPAFIKSRIMRSHFSLENVKEFFKANDLSAVKEIYLIHLSANNICRKTAIREIKELTGKPTFSFDKEGTNI